MQSDLARRVLGGLLMTPGGESTTKDYESIKNLIQKFPGLVRQRIYQSAEFDNGMNLPIFAFATKRIGATWVEHMELLELVYAEFPLALESTSSYGHLPLHTVCHKRLHPRIILYFLKMCPEVAMRKADGGHFAPLTYYLVSPMPLKGVVKALVKAAPAVIEFEYDNGREETVPGPLCLALSNNYEPNILNLLIPTNPISPCLKLDLEIPANSVMVGTITVEKAQLMARRVSGWLKVLTLDTSWFSTEGLATFLRILTESGVPNLEVLDIFIGDNVFAKPKVRLALSNLLRQSPVLAAVRARKPGGAGTSNDDLFLSAVAKGLEENTTVMELGLSNVFGRSFKSILSRCSSLKQIALHGLSFTARGVEALVNGIRESNTLMIVILSAMDVPQSGMKQICEALSSRPSLQATPPHGTQYRRKYSISNSADEPDPSRT